MWPRSSPSCARTMPRSSRPTSCAFAEAVEPLRIALVAPLVTAIAEPQRGGSQAVLADLAVGLTERGHVVDVFAATGSVIAGAHVVDTGVDSATLAAALIRLDRPRRYVPALDEAYEHVFGLVE